MITLKLRALLVSCTMLGAACGVADSGQMDESSEEQFLVNASHPRPIDSEAKNSDPQAACGLSTSSPVFGRIDYIIRNCHNYAVRRKLDLRFPVIGYPDGPCHYIPANSQIKDWISFPDGVYIAGIKEC